MSWNCDSIRLDTVLEPGDEGATGAPTAGAKNGYTPPTLSATSCAIATGIDTRSLPLTPELIRIRTMGMVKINTKPAPSRVLLDSPTAALSSEKRMRWRKKVISTTMHRMPPGRYSGSMVPDTPVSPRMSFQPKVKLISAAFTSGKVREITRNTASSR